MDTSINAVYDATLKVKKIRKKAWSKYYSWDGATHW